MAFTKVGNLSEHGLPLYFCLDADTPPTTGLVEGSKMIKVDGANAGAYVFFVDTWYKLPVATI